MEKVLSIFSQLAEATRRLFRQPEDPEQELDWDVEDPYEESMFTQIRAAEEVKITT